MPLSEHERRQLEQIEQALRADDPWFADAVTAADPWVHYKRLHRQRNCYEEAGR